MKYMIAVIALGVLLALWLEYRQKCDKPKEGNPYDLIDLQREIRKEKRKEK